MTCDAWPVDRSKLPPLPDESDDAYDVALLDRDNAIRVAIGFLWALSGRQYGVCETKMRPCSVGTTMTPPAERFGQTVGFRGYLIYAHGGWAANYCGCGSVCKLSGPRTVHLPGPVYPEDDDHPITVVINGDVLDPSEWAIEGDVLYRRKHPWPMQNLDSPEGDEGTWSVTYWRGQGVPGAVGKYVGLLAAEVLADDGDCRLPASVRRVARQGVSMEIDPIEIIKIGYTGIIEVDRWLASVNPGRLQQAPTVI